MNPPRILVFGGSLRTGSYSAQLAALAAKELSLLDAEVSHISLGDFRCRFMTAISKRRKVCRKTQKSCAP